MKGIKEKDDFPEYQSILKNLKQQFEDITSRYADNEKLLAALEADTKAREARVRKMERELK